MKLILIHGRAQGGKDSGVLKQEWINALRIGLAKSNLNLPDSVSIEFPFYGDVLDNIVEELNNSANDDLNYRGRGEDSSDFVEFRAEVLYEMSQAAGIKDEEINAYYMGTVKERGIENQEWVRAIAKSLEQTWVGDSILEKFLRDAYIYLKYPTARKTINEIIANHLTSDSCIVVGHSLGSVVGYNVLNEIKLGTKIPRFVTLGSPLGFKTFKQNLDTPLTMPACVDEWYNAFDKRDIVSLYPLDEIYFPVQPAIINKSDVDNHTSNRHGIAGYLDDLEVAHKIYSGLINT